MESKAAKARRAGLRGISAAALAVALVAPAGSAAATAPKEPAGGTELQEKLDILKRANPGARQLDSHTIKLRNGVIARVTLASGASAEDWPPSCGHGYLCLFSGVLGTGSRLDLFRCGFVNIGWDYGWSDKLRSLVDRQTSGTRSSFFNWNGAAWEWLGDVTAPYQYQNVPTPLWYTDGIKVC
ncbi:hypothetical protein ACQUSR_00520 [Streptomyces sp. P1-3]|uniref:hypothetical protein n=1 Tax=Streptomyces sp. P1-3 TaxID=3421658 RepID=UPI003D3600AC